MIINCSIREGKAGERKGEVCVCACVSEWENEHTIAKMISSHSEPPLMNHFHFGSSELSYRLRHLCPMLCRRLSTGVILREERL